MMIFDVPIQLFKITPVQSSTSFWINFLDKQMIFVFNEYLLSTIILRLLSKVIF